MDRSKSKFASAAGGAAALAIGFLIAKEGIEYDSYVDVAGVKTICVGHTGPEVELGQKASQQICEDLLSADLDPVWAAEDKYIVHVEKLPAWTRAAVASFTFNVGVPTLKSSSVLRNLNLGKIAEACNALLLYTKARAAPQGALVVVRGLVNRRVAERQLCLGEGWS
jgi:lysozyme